MAFQNKLMQCICYSPEETIAYGIEFGKSLTDNSVVCFFGDLGAGKTTFIKGLVQGFANYGPDQVNSPTFVYLNIYSGGRTVYHFDLYRLRDSDEFLSMGFDDVFYAGGICCVEWSEKIQAILPEQCIYVTLRGLSGENASENARQITIEMMDKK